MIVITETQVEILSLKLIGSEDLDLEPLYRISLHSCPNLSDISRVCATDRLSYVIIAGSSSIDAIQVPHDIKKQPTVKSFPIEDVPECSKILEFALAIRLRADYSMDVITYDLGEETDQIESQVHIGAFPGVRHLVMTACDEISGRLILSRDRDFVLLQV